MLKDFTQTKPITAYDVLGISPDAPQRDVHAALRNLAMAWHPDRVPGWRRGEATTRFQSIMDAYNQVRTPEGRKAYDTSMSIKPTRKVSVSNDNIAFGTKAKAWFKALETVFWPMRK